MVQRPGALRRRVRGGRDRRAPAARGGAHRRRGLAGARARGRRRRRAGAGRGPAGEQRREQPAVRRRSSTSRSPATSRLPPCARAPSSPTTRRSRPPSTAALEARGVTCQHDPGRRTSPPASAAPPTRWRRRSRASVRSTRSSSPSAGARSGDRVDERLGAGARRARRHRRAHPRRRRLGPGRGRPRRRRRPSGPAGDAHRRHDGRRPQPGPGVGAARPGRARRHRRARRRPSRSAWRRRTAAAGSAIGELVAHLRVQPRGRRRWPGPSWWPAPAGSACAATRARAAASPSAVPSVPDWLDGTLRSIVGAPEEAPMTRRPARVVDAHVHLWDPARTDWYPYLSGRQQLDMGDVSGMARRFDVPTYLAEAAGWNVEKLVNVAAATGRHSIDETLELDQPGRRRRPSRRHHRRPPADGLGGRGRGAARPADGGVPLPGRPPDGGLRRPAPGGRRAPAPCRSGAWCSS